MTGVEAISNGVPAFEKPKSRNAATTLLLLGAIGLALALPVPALLSRAAWPRLAPAAGIVLWQSLALAAVLAISGAALSTALWLVTDPDPAPWRVVLHVVRARLSLLQAVWPGVSWGSPPPGLCCELRIARLLSGAPSAWWAHGSHQCGPPAG